MREDAEHEMDPNQDVERGPDFGSFLDEREK